MDEGEREHEPSEFEKRLARLQESYSDLPILRAVAQLIPYVGGSLDTILTWRASEIRFSRIEDLLKKLREEIERKLEDAITPGFFETEAGAHLFMLALENAARTQQEEKRRLYARLLTNATGPEWATKPDMAEELLQTLADLSPRDVIILTRLKDLYRTLPGRGQSPHNLKPHFPDLEERELDGYIARLQRSGFIAPIPGFTPLTCEPTPLFDRLMRILAESEGQ